MASQSKQPEGFSKGAVDRGGQAARPFVRDFEPFFYGRPVTYVDVGAYVGGVFGQLLRSSVRVREAHLIEPNPHAFATMRATADALTEVERIFCHNVAISDTTGTVAMREDGTMTRIVGVPAAQPSPSGLSLAHFEVATITLDELVHACELDHVNLLKVDVEGHELQVLEGAKALLSAQAVDVIYIEAGMDPGSHQQSYYRAVEDVLRAHNYRIARVYEQRNEWPGDSLALRRVNLAFISSGFDARNPSKVSRELFQLRRQHEQVVEELRQAREEVNEREQQLGRQEERHRRLELDRDAAVSRLAKLEQRSATQQAKLYHGAELIDALTRERDAFVRYADELEAKYLGVLRSLSWRLGAPMRVATRTVRRALRRPVSGRSRLPKRPQLNTGRGAGNGLSPAAGRCGDIMRLLKASDFPALYGMKRELETQLATPEGFLGHAFLMITLARKISAFAFGAQTADAMMRRYDGRTGELLAALGERAYRRFVADAAVDYTRVGRYEDAYAILADAISAGHTELLQVRAEIGWPRDPESAAQDLRALEGKRVPNGDARKNALLLSHLDLNVLGGPGTETAPGVDDAVHAGQHDEGEPIDGEFLLVNAILAHIEERFADYRSLVNKFFAEQRLREPLRPGPEPFSFDELPAGSDGQIVEGGPLVTVIMTTFNSSDTVGYAVRSILEQTYREIELVIVDDASTDDTRTVLADLAAQDERITVVQAEHNRGTYLGRNRAIRAAQGQYLTFHDADDWAHPQRLQVHVEQMQSEPDLMATRSNWVRMDGSGRIDFRRWHRRLSHPNPASLFLRRDVVEAIGYFDPVRFSADSEYWYRAQRVLGRKAVTSLQACLGFGRLHEASLTRSGAGARDAEDYSPVRSAYQYSWWEWHSRTSTAGLYIDSDPQTRTFWAPSEMLAAGPVGNGEAVSLAVCYPGLEAQRELPAVVIGISLASKRVAADWALTETLLRRTLRSVLGQDEPRWRAVICGHDRPDLPELDDPRITFMEADVDPPTEARNFRRDKMWKRRLAAAVLRDMGGGYFCPLDADDLIHRGLVAHVMESNNRRGYGIDEGYVEDFANERLAPVPGVWSAPFDRVCGSSAVLYFDADELPRDGRPDPELGFNLFQAHAYWPIVAEELERPLEHIPFPAGVYVVNHSQNLSFGLQRAGARTANVIASIERNAVTDREGILRGEFGQE